MFKAISCYLLVCDGCDEEFENGEFTPHYDDPEAGLEDLENYEWLITRDQRIFCLACKDTAKAPACACPGDDPDCSTGCTPGCPCVRHERIESEGPCADCGQTFARQSELDWHRFKDHPKPPATVAGQEGINS